MFHFRGHPFHVHGYSFWVMDVFFPTQTVLNKTAWLDRSLLNLDAKTGTVVCHNPPICGELRWGPDGPPPITNPRPVRKDSVFVPAGGWVWLRIRADNAGWWLTHSHQGFHNIAGMAAAMYVGSASDQPATPTNFPRCSSFPSKYSTVEPTVATCPSGSRPNGVGPSIMSLVWLLLMVLRLAQLMVQPHQAIYA